MFNSNNNEITIEKNGKYYIIGRIDKVRDQIDVYPLISIVKNNWNPSIHPNDPTEEIKNHLRRNFRGFNPNTLIISGYEDDAESIIKSIASNFI